MKTFSIGFDDPRFNELPHARRVAERYGCEHHEFEVHPNAIDILPSMVRHYGEPYADSSAIPSFYLAQLTRRHVTVALNGDGGDEAFAGYGWHLAGRLAERWQMLPSPLRSNRRSAASTRCSLRAPIADRRWRGRRASSAARASRGPRSYRAWLSVFTPDLKRGAVCEAGAALARPIGSRRSSRASKPLDGVDAMLAADVAWYLPTDLLVKMDIATMAHSLESRSPFLDWPLTEFVARLPSDLKLRGADLEVSAEEGRRRPGARRQHASAQAGVRRADRRVVPRRAEGLSSPTTC